MNLKEYITEKKQLLREHILRFLDDKLAQQYELPYYDETLRKLKEFVPEGKLLRGILVILSYEMLNGKKNDHLLDISAAMEFNQSSLLIHDDIMDQDELRRGNKTMYAQYKDDDKNIINPLLYGQSMAICIGNIGYFLAFELLLRSQYKPAVLLPIITEVQLVGAAQMSDVRLAQSLAEPTYDEIMNVYRYKTGRYTFGLPLKVGAAAAEADSKVIEKLEIFGETLGIIFQLRDDDIKLFGSNESTGTSIASDIRENKKTIIRHLLYTSASESEKKTLNTIFGNASITEKDVTTVKNLLKTYGVMEKLREDMRQMTTQLSQIITSLPVNDSHKSLLQEFVAYNLSRSK